MQARNTTIRLALITLIPATMASCGLHAASGAEEGMFDRTLQVSGPVDLSVLTGAGAIKVQTGPPGTLRVVGHIRANGALWTGLGAADQVKRLQENPPIDQTGDRVAVGNILDPDLRRHVSISYELTVPVDTQVRSTTGSGAQVIGGVRGPVDVRSGSGHLQIDHVGDHVRALTGSGGVDVLGAERGLDARAGSGSIHAAAIAGAASMLTGSGSIDLTQVGPGDVEAKTGSGSVTIRMPPSAGFDVAATTGSGPIDVARPIQTQGTTSRHRVEGRVGSGGPRVTVTTGSGSIHIG